jgi:HEAT repeat protein
MGGTAAVDEILGALDRGGDNFLEAAAATLGELGDRRALPALEKLARHQNADVAKAASAAIQRLRQHE